MTSLRDVDLAVAAVSELLARPAASTDELAARLGVSRDELEHALQVPSVTALVEREADGRLRAAPGATSASLPLDERIALLPRPG